MTKVHLLMAVLLACLLPAACAESEEEACCTCLMDHGCTSATRQRCLDVMHVFQGTDTIPVTSQCVGASGCYTSCAAAGAFFDGSRMVVDYWKKKSLP